jgi:hypothetical protein
MLGSLALALMALRAGLAMRKRRLQRLRGKPDLIRRHLALAKPAVGLVIAGFLGGAVSSVMLRNWEPFGTFHGIAGAAAALLFALTAHQGMRAQRDRGVVGRHGLLGLAAVLIAALTAVAGFVLLP